MKKHIPLIVGLSLPVIFIIIISIVVFGPQLFINPQYSFVYAHPNNSYDYNYSQYKKTYEVTNGKIVVKEPVMPAEVQQQKIVVQDPPRLFRYDTKNHSAHEITLEEAQKLNLDVGPSSPDGYILEYRNGHDGIFELFGDSNNNNGYYITKGNAGKKLPGLSSSDYYYNRSVIFLGWIK